MSLGLGDKPFCAGIYLSLADIAVGCALGYLDFRFPDMDWRTDYSNLAKLQDKLMQRASFAESVPA
jgi:glutathione S-transferase